MAIGIALQFGTKLGAGSFALVFDIQGGPIAFKEILRNSRSDAEILRQEFNTLQIVYDTCQDSTIFTIPRPIAFNDSDAVDQPYLSAKLAEVEIPPARQRYPMHPFVSQSLMTMFPNPTYAMDCVSALPIDVSNFIARSYFPARDINSGAFPTICRLYLGQDNQTVPSSRFFGATDFPLDPARYAALHKQFPSFSSPLEEVARGMGEMLARMHFRAGVDARGVEFVLGSRGDSRLSYMVIDFDQVRTWTKGNDVSQLVAAFYDNDPYYPRPVSQIGVENGLYGHFKTGYLESCPIEDKLIGVMFIQTIESGGRIC